MILTPQQKRICQRVVNAFETGIADGDYGNVSIYHDGPHRIRQITYGCSQTTEYGNLHELISLSVSNSGQFSKELKPYLNRIGNQALVDDAQFKRLLKQAGNDSVMQQTQDAFFDTRYFQPAMHWATEQGFVEALSELVIYDSFIHSDSIFSFLRPRFRESPR
jgi:chitosanase